MRNREHPLGVLIPYFRLALYFIYIKNVLYLRRYQRPDFVISSANWRYVYVIELTVYSEENIDRALPHDQEKYGDLQELYIKNGWRINVVTVGVGCRRFIAYSIFLY